MISDAKDSELKQRESNSEAIESQKAYIIRTFHDLIVAIKENPLWLEELRKLILTYELLDLPEKVNEIAKGLKDHKKEFNEFKEKDFQSLVKKVDEIEQEVKDHKKEFIEFREKEFKPLVKKVDKIEQDVEVLKSDVEILKSDVEILKSDVEILKSDVSILKKDMKDLKIDVASLKGDNFERKVRERAAAVFGKQFNRLKIIPQEDWLEKLDEALDAGIISENDRSDALNIDLLIRAKNRDKAQLILAIEASFTTTRKDVERALKRALIFGKAYNMEAMPIVVSAVIPEQIQEEFQSIVFIQFLPE